MGQIGDIPILEALFILVAVVIYVWPVLHILISQRSHGGAKFGWFVAELFFPIIVYIVFLIVTQNKADSKNISNV